MDSSAYEMYTECYNIVISGDFNELLGIVRFDRKFKALSNGGNLKSRHWGEVEVIRLNPSRLEFFQNNI